MKTKRVQNPSKYIGESLVNGMAIYDKSKDQQVFGNSRLMRKQSCVLKRQVFAKTLFLQGKDRKFALALCAIPESTCENTYTKRFAFSQAGKCLVKTLLFDHPKISLLKLTDSTNNVVSSLETLPSIETRTNLETLLIGLYAGKAGELFSGYRDQSKNKEKVYALGKRKDLVRVNGPFANSTVLRAKAHLKPKIKFSQIMYTCDTLCGVSTKQSYSSQTGTFGLTGEKFSKQKGNVKIDALQVKIKLHASNRAWLQNRAVERCVQAQNVLPLPHVFLGEQYGSVLASLTHFAPSKQFNCARIEQFLRQSDTGLFERIRATFVVQSLAVNGSIYSPTVFNLQKNSILGNLNKTEIKEQKVWNLFQSLDLQIQNVYLKKKIANRVLGSNTSFLTHSYKKEFVTKQKVVTESFNSQASQSVDGEPYKDEIFATSTNTLLFSKKTNVISQNQEISALCEDTVCKSLTFSIKPYGHWFRIYLPQIETHQRQPVSADQFFKKRRELGSLEYKTVNSLQMDLAQNLNFCVLPNRTSVSIAEPSLSYASSNLFFFQVIETLESKAPADFTPSRNVLTQRFAHMWPPELGYKMCHYLVFNTFFRAFHLIGQNRELLDVLADHFIRFEKIRMPEISRLFSFYVNQSNLSTIPIDQGSVIATTRR